MKADRLGFWLWPAWQKIWFSILILGFFIIGAQFSFSNGNKEFARVDGTTEQLILFASDNYVKEGFTKYYLLPLSPPFGFDGEGNQRTEPFVYTHYFPGPYWVMGVLKKFFGQNGVWLTRLVPLAMNVGGLAILCIEFASFTGSALIGLLLLSAILTARSVTIFSISFAGHGYVMGMLLILIGILFRLANRARDGFPISKVAVFLWSVYVGFFQIWFSIDFLPLTFLMAVSFIFYIEKFPKEVAWRILLGLFVGGCLGFVLQISLFAMHLGSLQAVIEDFTKWGSWRMGMHTGDFGKAVQVEDTRLFTVLREYNKQAYGATGFTAYNLLILNAVFIFMGYFGKAVSKLQTKRLLLGLLFAYLSAIAWNVLMRQHSLIHIHFIPRHYYALFFYFLITVIPLSFAITRRSAQLTD